MDLKYAPVHFTDEGFTDRFVIVGNPSVKQKTKLLIDLSLYRRICSNIIKSSKLLIKDFLINIISQIIIW